jgi:GNAT superfamily N-acetyltransferase
MDLEIQTPQLSDIEELLRLYLLIYGRNYPIVYGTDEEAMANAIESPNHQWLIMRDRTNGLIVGSIVFELDHLNKIGKVSAMVVHPEYQGEGIASQLVSHGDRLISPDGSFNSLYTTARTQSIGPQLVFLREGYLPLGIFPNAHKLRWRETTTLLAKFRPDVLSRRAPIEAVPQKILPLYQVLHQKFPNLAIPNTSAAAAERPFKRLNRQDASFEAIYAPQYVLKLFREKVSVRDQFYPFHSPNLLLVEVGGSIEMFVYVNKIDGYCTMIYCNRPMYEIEPFFPAIVEELHSFGVTYIEILIGADRYDSIEALLRLQFLPSALYPAMREEDGLTHDHVIMTHTIEPLDFRGMAIEQTFKPYVDQYVALWKQMHLDSLEVFNDYKHAPGPESPEDGEHPETMRPEKSVSGN